VSHDSAQQTIIKARWNRIVLFRKNFNFKKANSSRALQLVTFFLFRPFVKNGRYEIPVLVNYRGFVTPQSRAFVTKNQGYRNELYSVIVTAVLIYTTLERQYLNYRGFVKNFTGLPQSLIQGNRTILYQRNMSGDTGLS
jgi:hypothetical protein